MASQIAHIIYAKKYFERLEKTGVDKSNLPPKALSRDEFILGCVFPDIRRIEPTIKRKDTHLHFPKLDLDFASLSSFEAGWKFHLYCDMKREEVLNKYAFYTLKSATDFYHLPAKILEDELTYDSYDNWEKIINYFNHPPYPALEKIGVTPETFRLWYAVIARYAEEKPSDKTMRIFLSKQPALVKKIDTIMASVARLRENKKATEILAKVKEEIV